MDKRKSKSLYIVIPCYNEEEVLPKTIPLFQQKLKELINEGLCNKSSKIVLVNDGSNDKTWDIITSLAETDIYIKGLSLSKNEGHQNALLAGLMYAKDKAEISISIDCDGQDDIDAMNEMLKAFYDGYDIVYGVRKDRETDSFFKKFTAESFYKLMNLMGTNTIFNHADYRLMSKKALKGLAQFEEVNLFLRGIVPLIGYKSKTVYYKRNERIAGESHYPFSKMLNLAINGITSLSVKPLRYITGIGFSMSFLSIIYALYALIQKIVGNTISGWTSLVFIMTFIGGVQLFCLGVIGEYIGKIYSEVKQRPKYIIEKETPSRIKKKFEENVEKFSDEFLEEVWEKILNEPAK